MTTKTNNPSRKYLAIALFGCCFFFASCKNNTKTEAGKMDTTATPKDMTSPEVRFTAEMVDNRKDPSCGMPVTAGIHDTAHYQQKVLGFCSAECKAEFEKDPVKYIAAADLKK